jgi:hypothetical protein
MNGLFALLLRLFGRCASCNVGNIVLLFVVVSSSAGKFVLLAKDYLRVYGLTHYRREKGVFKDS